MLNTVLAASLVLLFQGEPEPKKPTPEPAKAAAPAAAEAEVEPREAARRMARALKGDDTAEVLDAYQKYGRMDDSGIVRAVAVGLRHKEPDVRWASIIVLRYNPNSVAVTKLLNAKSDKQLLGTTETAVEYYRALGQHADKRAKGCLLDGLGPPKGEPDDVIMARIEALGRMPSVEALEGIVKYLRSGFARKKDRINDTGCLALAAMTGESIGNDPKAWVMWWNADRRNTFRMPDEPQPPANLAAEWDGIWKVPSVEKQFARIGRANDQEPQKPPERAAGGDGRRDPGR